MREFHVRALKNTLAPLPRVEALAQFDWRIEGAERGPWVLPDCVALARLDGGD